MSWTDLGLFASILGAFITLGSIVQADIHAAAQATLTDIAKGFRESH